MYDESYYKTIYNGFEDDQFARTWALGCRLSANIPSSVANGNGSVLEFGAGLGQNLMVIEAGEKWAVDLEDASRESCLRRGFRWTPSLDDVPTEHFDLLLSRHSLEHVPSPLDVLKRLRDKAKPGADFHLIVPYESMDIPTALNKFDEHTHFFAWSPMTIKNLLLEAGWSVRSITIGNGMFFKRSLVLLKIGDETFRAFRSLANRFLPLKSAEIIVHCTNR